MELLSHHTSSAWSDASTQYSLADVEALHEQNASQRGDCSVLGEFHVAARLTALQPQVNDTSEYFLFADELSMVSTATTGLQQQVDTCQCYAVSPNHQGTFTVEYVLLPQIRCINPKNKGAT